MNEKKSLKEYVAETLSHSKFSNLSNTLKISTTKLSRIWNNPKEEASLDIVLKLAGEMEVPAFTLIRDYGMGSKNISDYDMQTKEELKEGFVQLPKSA